DQLEIQDRRELRVYRGAGLRLLTAPVPLLRWSDHCLSWATSERRLRCRRPDFGLSCQSVAPRASRIQAAEELRTYCGIRTTPVPPWVESSMVTPTCRWCWLPGWTLSLKAGSYTTPPDSL